MTQKQKKVRRALAAAFPNTIPIFAGFWFLGLTYGVYMNVSGFSFIYPMLMSLTIFAGSIEFVTVNMLLGAFNPLQALAMALMINARHLFYGISMLDKYKGTGKKKIYLIYGMCDESFSINYTADIPEGVDRGWFMFFVTLLNHFYWFSGSTLGGIFGSLIHFNTEGLEFVMTAMFVVIFMEQWLKDRDLRKNEMACITKYNTDSYLKNDSVLLSDSSVKTGINEAETEDMKVNNELFQDDISQTKQISGRVRHVCSLLGIMISLICLIVFGADDFIIPTMIAILAVLTLLRRSFEKRSVM